MESTQNIKQRFGIIGNHPGLNRALEKTLRVASTEITVLVSGAKYATIAFINSLLQ